MEKKKQPGESYLLAGKPSNGQRTPTLRGGGMSVKTIHSNGLQKKHKNRDNGTGGRTYQTKQERWTGKGTLFKKTKKRGRHVKGPRKNRKKKGLTEGNWLMPYDSPKRGGRPVTWVTEGLGVVTTKKNYEKSKKVRTENLEGEIKEWEQGREKRLKKGCRRSVDTGS